MFFGARRSKCLFGFGDPIRQMDAMLVKPLKTPMNMFYAGMSQNFLEIRILHKKGLEIKKDIFRKQVFFFLVSQFQQQRRKKPKVRQFITIMYTLSDF